MEYVPPILEAGHTVVFDFGGNTVRDRQWIRLPLRLSTTGWTPSAMRAEIYWIHEVPCGRLGIVGRPRAGDWLVDEVAAWKAEGITDVISLLEDHEVRELELSREAERVTAAGLAFLRFPIPDRGVPASHTRAEALWNELADRIRAGGSIAVHCRAGIGRSGLTTAGILIQLGIPAEVAWERISRARGISVPDTEDQRQWVLAHARGRQPE